jgi:hypothetical protein
MNKPSSMRRRLTIALLLPFAANCFTSIAGAQGAGGPPGGDGSARAQAGQHFDLTGYWVPVVTDDWMRRMVTPPIGFMGQNNERVPYNDAGVAAGMAWSPDADVAAGLECKVFGVGNIMRMPARLHITWEDDDTLRIDTDYGEQTRLLRFAGAGMVAAAADQGTWQGHSVAAWEKSRQGRGFGPGPRGGQGVLKVVTTGMRAAYLTRNGFPYSEDATVTEYFISHTDFGVEWFTVTTIVEDPQYLTRPYVTSTQFRREPNDDDWNPRPCEIVPPFQ